jgi:RNA polymerase sigma-70 factor, ECF subfamily
VAREDRVAPLRPTMPLSAAFLLSPRAFELAPVASAFREVAGLAAGRVSALTQGRVQATQPPDFTTMETIEHLMQRATELAAAGALARQTGDESAAAKHFGEALEIAQDLVRQDPGRPEVRRHAVRFALDCGEAAEARRLLASAEQAGLTPAGDEEWAVFGDIETWPDAWLVAAVRRDPPDELALDVLVDRYWKPLFGRCQLLTLNHHKASDLAQEAWCRVLRVRHTLKPGGNFPAYLTTIATNLWRDLGRSARRAGLMGEAQMASLDELLVDDTGRSTALAEILPDLSALAAEEQKRLMLDVDQALEKLSAQARDVLVSRYLAGESCAEIGRRYGRTEQTISAWVRDAVQQMKNHLTELDRCPVPKEPQ